MVEQYVSGQPRSLQSARSTSAGETEDVCGEVAPTDGTGLLEATMYIGL